MEVTMIGLQNAGKTSLLRVLAVRCTIRMPSSIQPPGRADPASLCVLESVLTRWPLVID